MTGNIEYDECGRNKYREKNLNNQNKIFLSRVEIEYMSTYSLSSDKCEMVRS